jgi:hypothetical protein
VTGYSFHESDDANAPFCVDKHCNLQSMKNSCLFSIMYPDYSKLCACRSSSSVMYQGASVCFDCPVNSGHTLTGQAITACLCNLGYTGPDGRTCTACAAGKYNNATGASTCLKWLILCGCWSYSSHSLRGMPDSLVLDSRQLFLE